MRWGRISSALVVTCQMSNGDDSSLLTTYLQLPDQLCCAAQVRSWACFPECCNWQVGGSSHLSVAGDRERRWEGGGSSPPSLPRDRFLPCLLLQGWLTHTSINRVGSVVLPRRGAGPVLPSVTARGGRGQLSQSCDYYRATSSPTCAASRQLSNEDSSPVLTASELAHPCLCQQG